MHLLCRPSAIVLATACITITASTTRGQGVQPGANTPGSLQTGEQLFDGAIRFKNGGPPCGACHRFAGLPYPNGGSMGPDLTNEYKKLGPDGLSAALDTLYFPTMMPLFASHPLTPDEQQHLAAFIKTGPQRSGGFPATALLAAAAALGFIILMALTWIAGRNRVRSVRGELLRRAGLPTGAGR